MCARQKGQSGGFLLSSHRRSAQSIQSRWRQPRTATSSGWSRQMPARARGAWARAPASRRAPRGATAGCRRSQSVMTGARLCSGIPHAQQEDRLKLYGCKTSHPSWGCLLPRLPGISVHNHKSPVWTSRLFQALCAYMVQSQTRSQRAHRSPHRRPGTRQSPRWTPSGRFWPPRARPTRRPPPRACRAAAPLAHSPAHEQVTAVCAHPPPNGL
jgi:hypothetical protein